jgi:hypothetical protein
VRRDPSTYAAAEDFEGVHAVLIQTIELRT